VSREAHARFYESPGVRFPGATHQMLLSCLEADIIAPAERKARELAGK
jgi:hypothetical protein